MPAYDLDWQEYARHREGGGSLKDFADKAYLPFSDKQLQRHLLGETTIGIYPLLKDNTSWFIAADFDQEESKKKNWSKDCQLLTESY